MTTLSAVEHFEWLALRKVKRGGVTHSDAGFVDFGQPLGEFLAEVVAELLAQGLLAVDKPSPRGGSARVRHTEKGTDRYAQLCRQQRRTGVPGAGVRSAG